MASTVATRRAGPSIFDRLASRYPRTVSAFSSMQGGEGLLSAVADLERRWVAVNSAGEAAQPLRYVAHQDDLPTCPPENSFDVVVAGGGLGLIAGVALAQRGLSVLVFDRDRVGAAHREWNISQRELSSLVHWGLFTKGELEATVATRYKQGLISFHAPGTGIEACPLTTRVALDTALDAQAVLDLARRRYLLAGGEIKEQRAFRRLHIARRGSVASVFEVEGPHGTEYYRARLALDTMGTVSPMALGLNGGLPFDGVCPTVGTVVSGLELDRSRGDVLVSVAPTQWGRQLIWEGFPGRGNETTVYLFYYDRTGPKRARAQSLLDLYERYFTLLPTYRPLQDGFRHLKPLFGYIPARHGRTGRTAARGLICLGDSAAGQSPLTFCGFGSFVRHIGRVAQLLEYALAHNLLEERHLRTISAHQPNLRVAWVFSRFMQPWPGSDPGAVNRLMNVFCKALSEVGAGATLRFLQDRYTLGEYLHIMLATARCYPGVVSITVRVLGAAGLVKWLGDIAFFAADELMCHTYRFAGGAAWKILERSAKRHSPNLTLKLISMRTKWEATQ